MASENVLPSLVKLSVMDRLKIPTTIKVVVLCHPHPFEGHWQEKVIRQRTEELFANRLARGDAIDFFTLDPLRSAHDQADFHHGGAQTLFEKTKFSTTVRWDMIWVPDCGGEWYEMRELKGDAQSERFISLALTMSMSLKPGGFMMLGKLPFGSPELGETTLEHAVNLLQNAGFARVESVTVPDPYAPEGTPIVYILVQK